MAAVEGLDRWSETGARILSESNDVIAQSYFDSWVEGVAAWISAVASDSGLQADWFSIEPILVYGAPIEKTHARVRRRLEWLKRLPTEIQHKNMMAGISGRTSVLAAGSSTPNVRAAAVYVDPARLTELRHATGTSYSTARLVRLCEELNACMSTQSYLAAIMVLRAIKDHVPPIFGCKSFSEVVAQTNGRSFNAQLRRLETQATDVADRFLHDQIGPAAALPVGTQVDFRSELDALLGEVVARLKSQP